ncbi:hypothetical protein V6N13_072415 [Hibiscus sabdariffa]|uniref:Uncharacterized protein n=1 Tax=Hibiscus sabdariffa TaxID=183260 RepID=A0ABR2R7Q5_9ROSI
MQPNNQLLTSKLQSTLSIPPRGCNPGPYRTHPMTTTHTGAQQIHTHITHFNVALRKGFQHLTTVAKEPKIEAAKAHEARRLNTRTTIATHKQLNPRAHLARLIALGS